MNALPLQENLKKFTHIEDCPIRNIISRFSGKWTMLVLCILAENPSTRFSAIGKAIPDISPKVLSDTLKNLESDGLITRKIYAANTSTSRIFPYPVGRKPDSSHRQSHLMGYQ